VIVPGLGRAYQAGEALEEHSCRVGHPKPLVGRATSHQLLAYCLAMDSTYVALLRGINVGGKNRILMADLVTCFESAGYKDVRTFIQSGNVVFRADEGERAELTQEIERLLAEAFGYNATIALRDREEMRSVIDAAPSGFGGEPDLFRYDVLFLIPPLTPDEALGALTVTDGRRGLARTRRRLSLAIDRPRLAEPDVTAGIAPRVQADHYPELEDDDGAALPDGRGSIEADRPALGAARRDLPQARHRRHELGRGGASVVAGVARRLRGPNALLGTPRPRHSVPWLRAHLHDLRL